jgi:CelD/BcsL family acetyltransferase involved in cellulose biosynthesis
MMSLEAESAVNTSLKISVITSRAEFHELRQDWNALLENSDQNTIFLRWEWLYNWWTVYGGAFSRLYIYVIKEGNELVGIAPLFLKRKNLLLPFKEACFLGSGSSDYLNFIMVRNREEELYYALLSFMDRDKSWDMLKLADMPSSSKGLPLMLSFYRGKRINIDREYNVCPYIDLTSAWEDIYQLLSSKLKNTIRRKTKSIEKGHKIDFVEVSGDKISEDILREFVWLNRLRLKEKGIRAPFSDPDFLNFHKKIMKAFDEGVVNLCFMKADDKFVAVIYYFHYDRKYYYYQSGLDPEWKDFSPGTLLFYHCIKTAYQKGCVEFDFMRGGEEYKSSWTGTNRYNSRARIYNNTAGGLVLNSARNLKGLVKYKTKK